MKNYDTMKTQPFVLPYDYYHRWIRAAFQMAEKHYKLFVILGFLVTMSQVVISVVPYVGSLAAAVLRFIFALSSLRLMHALFQNQTQTIESFFEMSFDQKVIMKFKNHILACLALGLFMDLGMHLNLPHFYILTTLLSFALFLVPMTAYMQLRHPHLSDKEAAQFVLSQTWANVGSLIPLTFLLLFLGLASIVLFVVPFFIFFLPLTFPLIYLVYMGLCEYKTLEELVQNWNSSVTSPAAQ